MDMNANCCDCNSESGVTWRRGYIDGVFREDYVCAGCKKALYKCEIN